MAKGKRVEVKYGDRYGRLMIIEEVEPYIFPSGEKKRRVKCKCDCGSTTIVRIDSLRKGDTLSCGCLQKQKVSEVSSKTNEYDLSGECGIGYICNGDTFYFDLEDYDLIKDYCWCISKGYVISRGKSTSKTIRLHRLVMKASEDDDIDHINRNKLDNRKTNLRVCSHGDNSKNRGARKNNISGFTGVHWNKKSSKWQAYIRVNGKQIHLGYFTDINDAIRTRVKAELELFGEFSANYNYFTEEQREAILNDEMQTEEIVKLLNQKVLTQ